MNVAVVFFGLARCLPDTIESIRRKIYDCSANSGFSFSTIVSLNLVSRLNNPRAGEVDIPLNFEDVFLLQGDFYLLTRQDDSRIAEALAAAQRRIDPYGNDWMSVRNHLHQLGALYRAWQICENGSAGHFDYFLFVRPDLLYLDELRLSDMVEVFEGIGNIALPAWHSYGGFNDRFAFADPVAARHYAGRLGVVSDWCSKQPLHPESLLAYALDKAGCRVCELPVRARRVRANGAVIAEPFGVNVLPLPRKPSGFSFAPGSGPLFTKEADVMVSAENRLANRDIAPGTGQIPQKALEPKAPLRRVAVGDLARVAPLRGHHYIDFLRMLHRQRAVDRYLEIGTQSGVSLSCAIGKALAIDPGFMLDKASWAARPNINLFEMTSDDFFAAHDPRSVLGGPVELAFIDGMHLSEYVLRDFINVERYCTKDSIIVLHDAVPQNFEMTERDRRPAIRRDKDLASAWTGDVWRVVPLLRRERPDLSVHVLDCPPTGLVLVGNVDPLNTTLRERLEQLTELLSEQDASEAEFWSFIEGEAVTDSRRIF